MGDRTFACACGLTLELVEMEHGTAEPQPMADKLTPRAPDGGLATVCMNPDFGSTYICPGCGNEHPFATVRGERDA
jgi:hypothetical protein